MVTKGKEIDVSLPLVTILDDSIHSHPKDARQHCLTRRILSHLRNHKILKPPDAEVSSPLQRISRINSHHLRKRQTNHENNRDPERLRKKEKIVFKRKSEKDRYEYIQTTIQRTTK